MSDLYRALASMLPADSAVARKLREEIVFSANALDLENSRSGFVLGYLPRGWSP
jgi:hypothetical protein